METMELEVPSQHLPDYVLAYLKNRRILGLPELSASEIQSLVYSEPILRPTPQYKWQQPKNVSIAIATGSRKRARIESVGMEF